MKLAIESENFSKVPLETIVQNLEFDYEMQWPMNLIITPSHLNIYNKIFRFMMSLCLEKLRLVDLNMKDLSNRCNDKMAVHSLMLTRFRLSNTISSIFSFLLSQKLKAFLTQKISLNVQTDDICGSKTFDEMCKKHDSTVKRLLAISFLDGTHDILHRAIVKILDSSKNLALCWNCSETRYLQAQSIENEVDKCHKFLSYIVGKSQDSETDDGCISAQRQIWLNDFDDRIVHLNTNSAGKISNPSWIVLCNLARGAKVNIQLAKDAKCILKQLEKLLPEAFKRSKIYAGRQCLVSDKWNALATGTVNSEKLEYHCMKSG
uniref:Gamma-tubulin complex component n=1 Tax=Romanomermis culicivorax TaxID=13658 RepID=A0A915L577_ROMCU